MEERKRVESINSIFDEEDGSSSGSDVHSSEDFPDEDGINEDNTAMTKDQLAKKETQAVFGLRVIVIAFLVLKSVLVTIVMYSIARSGETSEFNGQYEAAAEKIIVS